MRKFECPKCKENVKALASEVGHRCPSFKSKWVDWEEIKNDQ